MLSLLIASSLISPQGAVQIKPKATVIAVKQRALVIVGGWSNQPEDFLNTVVVNGLARDLRVTPTNWPGGAFERKTGQGDRYVLLTRHRDRYGDIPANAEFEARQIAQFLNEIRAENSSVDLSFDLIGFSMGGLISRTIALDFSSLLGPNKIRNLVTMGTPNHGVSPVIVGGGVLMNTAGFESSAGVRQMMANSDFLRQLNARTIPASMRVSSIAGSGFIEAMKRPHAHDTIDVPCTHIQKCPHMKTVLGKQVPEHPLGCPAHGSDKKDIPCAHPPTAQRSEIGADGLVRVLSVRLRPGEAANVAGQHVLTDLWHTEATLNAAAAVPMRPFINAKNCPPEDLDGNPPPLVGSAVRANHFFIDSRVLTLLKTILA